MNPSWRQAAALHLDRGTFCPSSLVSHVLSLTLSATTPWRGLSTMLSTMLSVLMVALDSLRWRGLPVRQREELLGRTESATQHCSKRIIRTLHSFCPFVQIYATISFSFYACVVCLSVSLFLSLLCVTLSLSFTLSLSVLLSLSLELYVSVNLSPYVALSLSVLVSGRLSVYHAWLCYQLFRDDSRSKFSPLARLTNHNIIQHHHHQASMNCTVYIKTLPNTS